MALILHELAEDLAGALSSALQATFDSVTPFSLLTRDTDVERWRAQGVLREATLSIPQFKVFLATPSAGIELFFDRYRTLLFVDEEPIGSAGFRLGPGGSFGALDHVTRGGVGDLVARLGEAEESLGDQTAEARLLRVPQLYLETLVLLSGEQPLRFAVITPQWAAGLGSLLGTSRFVRFATSLLTQHEREFAPER